MKNNNETIKNPIESIDKGLKDLKENSMAVVEQRIGEEVAEATEREKEQMINKTNMLFLELVVAKWFNFEEIYKSQIGKKLNTQDTLA